MLIQLLSKEKKYPKGLENYEEEIIFVRITYDKETKEHICQIEETDYE